MNEQETHAEVIAEMRGAKTEFPFVYLMGEPDTPEIVNVRTKEILEPCKINIRCVTVKELANRLEAAHERERGNIAALREALKAIGGLCAGLIPTWDGAIGRIKDITEAALATPARNCDMGSADEQAERYGRYCDKFTRDGMHCEACPCCGKIQFGKCEFAWAQMPYEEGGEK